MDKVNGVLPRFLPDRSRLEFHYPDEQGTIVFLPFYENPEIKETQNANYATYNPIGRGGSLYAYTGSESRKFKVKLTYTLPHLAIHPVGISRFMRVALNNTAADQRTLFTQYTDATEVPGGTKEDSHANQAKRFFKRLFNEEYGLTPTEAEPFTGVPAAAFGFLDPDERIPGLDGAILEAAANISSEYDQGDKVIDTLVFFATILRTTTMNNAEDPLLGPPILRLNHGTLYQSIPCICKNYNIGWVEEAGYDLHTLTPRRLTIDLSLEEVRSASFEPFDAANITGRNVIAGWEQTLKSPWTMDSTNNAFRE